MANAINLRLFKPPTPTIHPPSSYFRLRSELSILVTVALAYEGLDVPEVAVVAVVAGGIVGIAGRGPYHATKHGVLGMTKSTALEYAARGIRINAVCPGIIGTPMVASMKTGESDAMDKLMKEVPIDRLGRAEEVADAVLWLCSSGSTFVIGHALVVDGGYTIR